MKSRKEVALNIAGIILCIFGIVALKTFASPCESGMKCVKTVSMCITEFAIAIMAHIPGTIDIFAAKDELKYRITSIFSFGMQAVSGLLIMLYINGALPDYGFCNMADMACRTRSMPLLMVIAPVLIGISAGKITYDVVKIVKVRKKEDASC